MKIGSVEHKELFCRSFMESYIDYEPKYLPCPDLDDTALTFLRSIPFWEKALDAERQAGAIVSGYAATVNDRLLQNAIALQGKEELRHARLLQTLIDRYGIEIPERQPIQVPQNFGNGDTNKTGFAATGTSIFTKDLTIEKFLDICLAENQRRMSKYDPRLLQPQLLPRLASVVLRTLELIPRHKPETVERASV